MIFVYRRAIRKYKYSVGKIFFFIKLSGIYCNQGHINRRDFRSSGISRCAERQFRTDVSGQPNFPLRMEPIGCPETSVTIKLSCVTTPEVCRCNL